MEVISQHPHIGTVIVESIVNHLIRWKEDHLHDRVALDGNLFELFKDANLTQQFTEAYLRSNVKFYHAMNHKLVGMTNQQKLSILCNIQRLEREFSM